MVFPTIFQWHFLASCRGFRSKPDNPPNYWSADSIPIAGVGRRQALLEAERM
jgi:hypothetical protein